MVTATATWGPQQSAVGRVGTANAAAACRRANPAHAPRRARTQVLLLYPDGKRSSSAEGHNGGGGGGGDHANIVMGGVPAPAVPAAGNLQGGAGAPDNDAVVAAAGAVANAAGALAAVAGHAAQNLANAAAAAAAGAGGDLRQALAAPALRLPNQLQNQVQNNGNNNRRDTTVSCGGAGPGQAGLAGRGTSRCAS